MAIYAKVTDILTTGFAEIELLGDEYEDEPRCIAEFTKKTKVHRDDVIEVEPMKNRIMNDSRIAYVIPPVLFFFILYITKNLGWGERFLSAAIVGFLAFIISWIMNRRSRMLKHRSYKVVRLVKEDPNHI